MGYEIDVLLLSVFFSIVSGISVFLQGVREGTLKKSFWDFSTEIVTAFIGGALAFYLCKSHNVDDSLMVFCVIAASNNGREAVVTAKKRVFSMWGSLVEFIKYKSSGGKS